MAGYELHERIGEGSFAVVYRGHQPSLDRDVAVKVIRSELADRPEFVRRFEAEAQLVARLEHPHVVPLHDFWRAPGAAYLVMRLFPGTLAQRLEHGPLETAEAAALVRQIGSALSAAHAMGVVHRDVKPANVCLDDAGNCYLGDFGIAYDALAVGGGPPSTGSPGYASPEQLRGEPAGPPADVYGLGATLRAALGPGDAARAAAVLARATAPDPGDRPPTVDALAADVLAALGTPAGDGAERRGGPQRNPYKGLRPFAEADAADFFGRTRLVDRLAGRLAAGDRMLTVVGPSGSGKSSAVHAGLLPRLREGVVPGSQRWYVTGMTPGSHPVDALDGALAGIAVGAARSTASAIAADPDGIERAVRDALPDPDGVVLLVIDQLEELFTVCSDADERDAFAAALAAALAADRSPLRVVATLRADLFDQPLRHPSLAPLVETSAIAVTPLTGDELASAIGDPGRSAGLVFEDGLVTRIAADVVDRPGALPLLQYALTELAEQADGAVLTLVAYEASGGVGGAVTQRAEQLYASGTEAERLATRRLFTRLAAAGEGLGDTLRRVRRAELGADPDTGTVMNRYGAARLLSFDRDAATREPTVEMAHEALLREWPRLRGWLDDDREGLRVHRHLTAAAAAWDAGGRDGGDLYRGARLEQAAQWAEQHATDLNPVEQAFLDASVTSQRAAAAAATRFARRLRRSLVAVAAVAVLALVAGGLAWRQQRAAEASRRDAALQRDAATDAAADANAQRQRAEASSTEAQRQRVAAEVLAADAETARMAAIAPGLAGNDSGLALLVAAEANRRRDDPRTKGALHDVLVTHRTAFLRPGHLVWQLGFDSDGDLVTFGNQLIEVWDSETHERLRVLPVPAANLWVPNLPFQPIAIGGDLVAWIAPDRRLWVADLRTGSVRQQVSPADLAGVGIDEATRRIGTVTLTGEVSVLAPGEAPAWTAAGDGRRTLADLERDLGGQLTVAAGGGAGLTPVPGAVVFDGAGHVLVSRGAGVRVLDAATGVEQADVVWTSSLAFGSPQFVVPLGPDGSRVVLTDSAGAVLIDLDEPVPAPVAIPLAVGSTTWITASAAGTDAFAVANLDGTVTVFDTQGRVVLAPVNTELGSAWAVRLDPAGRTLVAAGRTGAAFVPLDGGLVERSVPVAPGITGLLGTSGDLAYTFRSTAVPFPAGSGAYVRCAAACVPAGEIPTAPAEIAHASVNGWIPVAEEVDAVTPGYEWRVHHEDGRLYTRGPVTGAWVTGGSFLPRDGSWIALVAGARPLTATIEVYALPDWTLLARHPLAYWPRLAGGPQPASILVMDTVSGASQLLDTTTWTLGPSPLAFGEAREAQWSPDGSVVVTLSTSGELMVRDGDTLAPRQVLSGALASVRTVQDTGATVAISDDGAYVLAAVDGQARLWDVATGAPVGSPFGTVADDGPRPTVASGPAPVYLRLDGNVLRRWAFDVGRYRELACRAAGRNMTREEWATYGPRSEPYRATCEQWPADYTFCSEVQGSCPALFPPS